MRQLLLVCLLALAWATPSSARQDGQGPRRTRDRFAAYLERKPFHEQAFARLIEAAAASDGVAALRTSYTERAALEDAEPATRIVLARILARDGELLPALELLGQLESQSTALDVLRGRLLLAADRPEEAAAVLAPAAEDPAAMDRRLAEELFGLLAQAHLATGARDAASAALRAQGELDPNSFELALEIADALAQAGLQDAALVEYERAGKLAGQDSERLCRVLARSGRLHERRAEFELAIADYNAALGRLRRGHWLERELGARLGQTHATAGSLPAYAETLSERIAEHPADLGLRERLFRAKLDLHDPEGARLVLAQAVATHASDLPIGRLYSAHLDRMGRDEERAVELQRLIEEHPGEMDLYLDLGRLLAREGKLDQARRQWERSLEQRVGDVGFLLRLAQLFDRYGLSAEASGLVERAIEQEPGVLSHFAELGGLALRAGDRAGVQNVLDRAEQVAGDKPARLEELASIARGLRRKGAARGYMERAVVLAPKDAHLWRLLATVAAEQRDGVRAVEALRQVLAVADELTLKREALSQLVRRSQMAGNLESLIIADLEAAQAGAAVPSLVVARAYRRQNRSRQALELLAAVTEPGDLVREEHASTLEELGLVDEAVALYESLATERPARKVSYLREIVRLHRGEKNLEAAAEVVERILVASPNLPAVWRDAARSFEQLKQGDRALEVMQRAVDLAPRDSAMRLAHAEMLLDNDQLERAIAAARLATDSDDEELVDRARAWLHRRLVGRNGVEPEIARLRAVLAANPYDDGSALALIDLFERELEYSLALDLIGGLLDARPQAAQLLDLRAQLLDEMGRFEECLDDLERLKRLDALDVVQLAAREARAALALGHRDRAERALSRLPARRAASVYEKAGLEDEALACLEAERVRHPEDLGILQSLLRVQRARGNRPEAEALLDDLLLSEGESAQAFVRRGDLAFEFHDVDKGITWYARSLALDTPEVVPEGLSQRESRRAQRRLNTEFSKKMSAIQTKLQSHQLWYASADVLIQAARLRPDNSTLVARALSAYTMESRGSERMDLLEFVRAETLGKDVLPPGLTAAKWEQRLDSLQRNLIRSHPELARERSAELTDVAALSKSELKEALSLARDQSDDEQLRRVAMEMLARSSEDRRALALLIELDLDGNDEEAAEAGMRRLLGMSTFVRARAKLQSLPRVPRKHQSREQAKLPEGLRDAFTKDVAAQHYYLGRSARWKVGWGRSGSPNVQSLIASLGFLLAEQGREAEARELLGELVPPSAYMVGHTAHLADLYRDLEWTQEADALEGPARTIVTAALADPVLQSGVRMSAEIVGMMLTSAALEAGEDAFARYRHERLWVGPDGAYRSRLKSEEGDYLREQLKAQWGQAREQELPYADLRVAAVLYGEALVVQEDWVALEGVVLELIQSLQNSEATGSVLALQQREDRLELRELRSRVLSNQGLQVKAVELMRADIEASDADLAAGKVAVAPREIGFGDGEPKPMDPRRPSWFELKVDDSDELVQFTDSLARGIDYAYVRSGGTKPGVLVDLPLRARLFCLLARFSMHEEALACFAEMIQANSGILNWIEYPLSRVIATDNLKGSAFGFAELLHKQSPSNPSRLLTYGKALVKAERSEEAQRLYETYLASGSRDAARVEAALEKLRPAPVLDIAAAEEQVASDPRNMSLRRDLARQMFAAGRVRSGALHGLEASALGPHIAELRLLGIQSLAVLGRDVEWETAVRDDLARGELRKSQMPLAIHLGAMLWQRGEEQAAVDLFAGLAKRMNFGLQTSFANFFVQRGRMDLAVDQITLETKIIGASQPWIQDQLEGQMCEFMLRSGRGEEAMELLVKRVIRESEGEPTEDVLEGLQQLLEQGQNDALRVSAMRAYIAKQKGRTARLGQLALDLIDGDWEASEPALMELGMAGARERSLCLRAVKSAREREDWAAAADYLGQIEARYAPNRRRKLTSDPEYTERQAMDLEMGEFLVRMGDMDAGLARWQQVHRNKTEGQLGLLTIDRLARAGRSQEALERWAVREQAGQELPELQLKAALQADSGDTAGALGTLMEVIGSEGGDLQALLLMPQVWLLIESLDDGGASLDFGPAEGASESSVEALAWLRAELQLREFGLGAIEDSAAYEQAPDALRLSLLELSILGSWRRGEQEAVQAMLVELRTLEEEQDISPRDSWTWRVSLLMDGGNSEAALSLLMAAKEAKDNTGMALNLKNLKVTYGLKERAPARQASLEKVLSEYLAVGPLSEARNPCPALRKHLSGEPALLETERETFAASDGGIEARLRLGAACFGAGSFPEAVELLRSVLAEDADRLAAHRILANALEELGDTAGALQAVRDIGEHVRRMSQVETSNRSNSQWVDSAHLEALLKHAGAPAAEEWLKLLGQEPFAPFHEYEYSLYRSGSFSTREFEALKHARRYGLWEFAAGKPSLRLSCGARRHWLTWRLGQPEAAWSALVADVRSGVLGKGEDFDLLLRLGDEGGHLVALRAELLAIDAAPRMDTPHGHLLLRLAEHAGDWEAVVTLLGDPSTPESITHSMLRVRALRRLGRHEEAFAYVDARPTQAWLERLQGERHQWAKLDEIGAGLTPRFQFGDSDSNSSMTISGGVVFSAVSVSTRGLQHPGEVVVGGTPDAWAATRMLLAWETGRHELAEKLEQRFFVAYVNRKPAEALRVVINSYIKGGELVRAAELIEELSSLDPKLGESMRTALQQADKNPVVRLARLRAEGAKPSHGALAIRLAARELLLHGEASDAALAREWLQRAEGLEPAPDDRLANETAGWIAFLEGDESAARRAFRRAYELSRMEGWKSFEPPANLIAGLALARAQVDVTGTGEATSNEQLREVRRALSRLPDSGLTPRLETRLAALQP